MVSAHLVDLLVMLVEITMVMVGMVEYGTDTVTKEEVVVTHPTSEVRMDPLLMVDLVWQVMHKVVTTVEVAVEDTLAVALVVTEETVGEAVEAVHMSLRDPLTMLVATVIRVLTVVKVT